VFLIALALVCADPQPQTPRFAEFFELQDKVKADEVKKLEDKIKDLDEAIKGETSRSRQATLRGEKNRTEKELENARKRVPMPRLGFPVAKNHSIGLLPDYGISGKVVALIDDHTVVVSFLKSGSDRCNVVVTNIDAKHLKLRQPFTSNQVWHVTASPVKNEELLKVLNNDNRFDALSASKNTWTVEPISEKMLKDERAIYDADKAKRQKN
jgi:hypothetical protein